MPWQPSLNALRDAWPTSTPARPTPGASRPARVALAPHRLARARGSIPGSRSWKRRRNRGRWAPSWMRPWPTTRAIAPAPCWRRGRAPGAAHGRRVAPRPLLRLLPPPIRGRPPPGGSHARYPHRALLLLRPRGRGPARRAGQTPQALAAPGRHQRLARPPHRRGRGVEGGHRRAPAKRGDHPAPGERRFPGLRLLLGCGAADGHGAP